MLTDCLFSSRITQQAWNLRIRLDVCHDQTYVTEKKKDLRYFYLNLLHSLRCGIISHPQKL